MDKMKCLNDVTCLTREAKKEKGVLWLLEGTSVRCLAALVFCLVFSGCATVSKTFVSSDDQKLQAVAVDLANNPESRGAAEKILGVNTDQPVVKYSPVTGKHYSGDLEFDPETGAKLEVVKE
ncbi:MAG: hypothetical protein HQL21_08150 [Candidatus Omnitrophica bacterium]|nr:hypothetical protein [Candidatus Omnitrophota bacterium]